MIASVPRVSVVLAVNRDDGFLDEAVASVLNQTFRDFEFIIVANCCSDELWERLQAIPDSRVVPVRTAVGQLPFNLNVAIDRARGEYIARMDADDVCEPERFERQLQYLDANRDVDVLGSSYIHIDGSGRHVGNPRRLKLTHKQIDRSLPFESCMPHPTVMFRRTAVLSVGGYAYGLYAEDWDLWLRMARRGLRFANLPEPLLQYRIHAGQSTSHATLRRNMANVVGLLVREMVLSGRVAFIAGVCSYVSSTLFRALVAKLRNRHA
jgi:glycosyltransferase involved in cell wall biosynthesis